MREPFSIETISKFHWGYYDRRKDFV